MTRHAPPTEKRLRMVEADVAAIMTRLKLMRNTMPTGMDHAQRMRMSDALLDVLDLAHEINDEIHGY